MKKVTAKTDVFQEEYWLNTSEYDPAFPGIRVESFCHSSFSPKWQSKSKKLNYIMASMILSGESSGIDSDGTPYSNAVNTFQITDLNDSDEQKPYLYKKKAPLERYFILFQVNHLLRNLIRELFPTELPNFISQRPQRLKECFEDILSVLRKHGRTDDHVLGAMGFRLLTEAASQAPARKILPEPLTLALRYMDNQFCNPAVTRTEIAAAAGVSTVLLGKLSRQYLGMTIWDYVLSLRMEKAKFLLRTTTLSSAAVAEHCGFRYGYYFAKVFRSKEKISPVEYRKKLLQSFFPDR